MDNIFSQYILYTQSGLLSKLLKFIQPCKGKLNWESILFRSKVWFIFKEPIGPSLLIVLMDTLRIWAILRAFSKEKTHLQSTCRFVLEQFYNKPKCGCIKWPLGVHRLVSGIIWMSLGAKFRSAETLIWIWRFIRKRFSNMEICRVMMHKSTSIQCPSKNKHWWFRVESMWVGWTNNAAGLNLFNKNGDGPLH